MNTNASSSSDLVLTESATLRRQHIDRTDVLDKVKALQLLPDGVHMTTALVANYYEVSPSTLDTLASVHQDELAANGRRVLKGADLHDFATLFGGVTNLGVSPKTRAIALFDRRAILNVGMLLRDSLVAQQIRGYLLDAETLTPRQPSRKELAKYWYEAEERAELAESKVAVLEPRAAVADTWLTSNDTVYVVEWAKTFELTEKQGFTALREMGVLFKRGDQNVPRKGYEWYFDLVDEWLSARRKWVKVPKLTAEGQVIIGRMLVEQGYASSGNRRAITPPPQGRGRRSRGVETTRPKGTRS